MPIFQVAKAFFLKKPIFWAFFVKILNCHFPLVACLPAQFLTISPAGNTTFLPEIDRQFRFPSIYDVFDPGISPPLVT
jgi:hypothetical protein